MERSLSIARWLVASAALLCALGFTVLATVSQMHATLNLQSCAAYDQSQNRIADPLWSLAFTIGSIVLWGFGAQLLTNKKLGTLLTGCLAVAVLAVPVSFLYLGWAIPSLPERVNALLSCGVSLEMQHARSVVIFIPLVSLGLAVLISRLMVNHPLWRWTTMITVPLGLFSIQILPFFIGH